MTRKPLIILTVAALLFFILVITLNNKDNIQDMSFKSETENKSVNFKPCSDHDPSKWHSPVKRDELGTIICSYGHEHGDQAPSWIKEAGYNVGFDHHSGFHSNTSEIENSQKHTGMKGFLANIKGVDVFLRIHLASNPLERTARYHSYELFAKDEDGGISHFQGWLDTGDPKLDRIPYSDSTYRDQGKDTGKRPIVWAVTKHACEIDKTWCIELWTLKSSSWGPEIIWSINDPTTYFNPKEVYETDTSKWEKTGGLGGDRTMGFTFIKSGKTGKIWATQFGEIVSGPDDPKCFETVTKFGNSYQNICLENNISETLPEVKRIGNTVNRIYDTTGVKLPN